MLFNRDDLASIELIEDLFIDTYCLGENSNENVFLILLELR